MNSKGVGSFDHQGDGQAINLSKSAQVGCHPLNEGHTSDSPTPPVVSIPMAGNLPPTLNVGAINLSITNANVGVAGQVTVGVSAVSGSLHRVSLSQQGGLQAQLLPNRPLNLRLTATPLNLSVPTNRISTSNVPVLAPRSPVVISSLRAIQPSQQFAQIPILAPAGSFTMLPGGARLPISQVTVAGRHPYRNITTTTQSRPTLPSSPVNQHPFLANFPSLQCGDMSSSSVNVLPAMAQQGTMALVRHNLKEILPKGSEQHLASERARMERERREREKYTPSNAFISHILGKSADKPKKVREKIRELPDGRKDGNSNMAAMSTATPPAGGASESTAPDLELLLEWQGPIGYMRGSDLKFQRNDKGELEIVGDIDGTKPPTVKAAEPARVEVHSQCLNCGAPRVFYEGKFCSQSCNKTYKEVNRTVQTSTFTSGTAQTNLPTQKAPWHKKKKRKISEIYGEKSPPPNLPKIPKLTIKFEDQNKAIVQTSGSVSSTPAPEVTPGDDTATSDEPVQESVDDRMDYEPHSPSTPRLSPKKNPGFSWPQYLEQEKAVAAPNKCFRPYQDIPVIKNLFKTGMRLEAIDPNHPGLYCSISVAEVKGYRVRLHFDGYSESYDFWRNADSPFIFPTGWASRNGKKFCPPKGYALETFDWTDYLKEIKAIAAPKNCFSFSIKSVTPNSFRVGMKLEAVDKKNSLLICVATVADLLGDLVLVHFDGWEDVYDYWCEPSSPNIHPIGYCQEAGLALSPPPDWTDYLSFTWDKYLEKEKASAVPARAFKNRAPNQFEVGQKLEVVDKRNPILVRVATIAETKVHSVKVHFDSWSDLYDYWLDDDCPDLHPVAWCAKTGHEITSPPSLVTMPLKEDGSSSCPTPGCTGVGHVKGPKYLGHHSTFGCPYSSHNLHKDPPLMDRLAQGRGESESGKKGFKKPGDVSASSMTSASPMKTKSVDKDGGDSVKGVKGWKGKKLTTDIQEANEFMTAYFGKPMFGKGSGRGRKKTYSKLIKEYRDLKAKVQRQTFVVGSSLSPSFAVGAPSTSSLTTSATTPIQIEVPSPSTTPPTSTPSISWGTLDMSPIDSKVHNSVFHSSHAGHPHDKLPLDWEENIQVLASKKDYTPEQVGKWSIADVADFISKLPGCKDWAEKFTDQQIDGESFLLLDQADLIQCMKMKLGPAIKIHNSIVKIKNTL